jgi:hypothetical protein
MRNAAGSVENNAAFLPHTTAFFLHRISFYHLSMRRGNPTIPQNRRGALTFQNSNSAHVLTFAIVLSEMCAIGSPEYAGTFAIETQYCFVAATPELQKTFVAKQTSLNITPLYRMRELCSTLLYSLQGLQVIISLMARKFMQRLCAGLYF